MLRTFPLPQALMLAFGSVLLAQPLRVTAQDAGASPDPAQRLERVEITGSAIRRLESETSVPVTTYRVDELRREGVTTVEQIVSRLSSGQQTQGSSQAVGLGTGGASFANMRGLGQNKTLVLLNGRRLANNAIDSSAPDLNMIPMGALDRVEVLRDGASALYGTDAIGGVINFITKREFAGGSVSLGYDSPQHPGGRARNANVAFGTGSLADQGWNVFGFVDYQQQDAIRGSQRPRLIARDAQTSPVTSPGQYDQGSATQNPTYPGCGADGVPGGDGVTNANCEYLYGRKVDQIPYTERQSAFVKGTLALPEEHRLSAEYLVSQSRNTTLLSGVPYGALWMNPGTRYFPGNGITPLPTVFTLNPGYLPADAPPGAQAGGINVQWRDTASGGREEQTDNTQQRLVLQLEGSRGGWDYRTGLSYNENKITDRLIGGYTDGTIITAGVMNGTINPFGDQDAAGTALIRQAAAKGVLYTAKGQVTTLDAQASRELGDWFVSGSPAMLAVGAEVRREKFRYVGNPPFDELVVSSTGFDPATDNRGSRTVKALYAELSVPVLKELELTAALRHDRYSDFGSTTNPKFSLRYQPARQVLVRGSYSTGFRAPSLYDLYAPQTYTNSANTWDDPVRCPGGVPLPGLSAADNCGVQFLSLIGGNRSLRPERSKNLTFGLVFEPTPEVTTSIDFWWIRLREQIGALPDTAIFGDPVRFAQLFNRAPDGSLSTDGSQCPGANCGFIQDLTENLGGARTNGVDLSAAYRLRAGEAGTFVFGVTGTYVAKFEYQSERNGPWRNNLGVYGDGVDLTNRGGGPVFRWQHAINVSWTRGPFGLGLVNQFKSHYRDADPSNTVASYSTWDVYGTWLPTSALTLTAGIRNLFDREPPFSNEGATFQTGYDPRFTDPTGRTFYLRGTYSF